MQAADLYKNQHRLLQTKTLPLDDRQSDKKTVINLKN